jgi:hypothetical protein
MSMDRDLIALVNKLQSVEASQPGIWAISLTISKFNGLAIGTPSMLSEAMLSICECCHSACYFGIAEN